MLSLKGGRKERREERSQGGWEDWREGGRKDERDGNEWMPLCVYSYPLILSLI